MAKDIALNIGLKSEIVPSSVPPSAGTNKTLKGLSLVPSALIDSLLKRSNINTMQNIL